MTKSVPTGFAASLLKDVLVLTSDLMLAVGYKSQRVVEKSEQYLQLFPFTQCRSKLSLIPDQCERPPQCQPHSAKRLQLIQNQRMFKRSEEAQSSRMYAIYILMVQFNNDVQFSPKSQTLRSVGLTRQAGCFVLLDLTFEIL